MAKRSYHSYSDLHYLQPWWAPVANGDSRVVRVEKRQVAYRFSNHFHPYVGDLSTRLVRAGIQELQNADTARADGGQTLVDPADAELYDASSFGVTYRPTAEVDAEYLPVRDLDFSSRGAYSVYNTEIFFHAPLTIAIHLSRNQRFQEAQRWFHFLFDPTDDSDGPTPQRFWKVKTFQLTEIERIERILVNLATREDEELLDETVNAINEWKDNPFRPHVVARRRQSAYMYKTVMAYLDNLIAWGDHLFSQDTRETINEAAEHYISAFNILGPRPQPVPKSGEIRPKTYADIRSELTELGTVLEDIETTLPFDTYPLPGSASGDAELAALASMGRSLYFCVPPNDKLLEYWDTVADRLFKIRNSLNIRGIFRQLPLYDSPIDPALLARAAAAGLDVSAVVAGLNQPMPLVRFRYLIEKATELADRVSSLGSSLLSAIEKEDAEALATLRASHEKAILALTESVRYSQWQEAIKARESLERSMDTAVRRYVYYERLLGVDEDDIELPEMDELDVQQLLRGRLRSDEPEVSPRLVEIDIAGGGLFEGAGHFLNQEEALELQLQNAAEQPLGSAMAVDAATTKLHYLPTLTVAGHPMGAGLDVTWGTANMTGFLGSMSGLLKSSADVLNRHSARVGRVGGYSRREQEWAFQSSLAAGEIGQILKQLRAAQLREFIAKREHDTHQRQMVQADEIEVFLTDERKGKTTSKKFYSWMRREVQALHSQCFQLAFDVAKKAERALQHELGDTTLNYLKYNYAAGKQGLLAGEKLHLDCTRMNIDNDDRNPRRDELTADISLLQIEPIELIRLRKTGRCRMRVPEEVFDLNDRGCYFRRIKSVALSLPGITGQYTSVNCTLTLLKSSVRTSPLVEGGYGRDLETSDLRFSDYYGSVDAIVTSTAVNDAGMFDVNLDDAKYLPFENFGVISEWELRLPADPSQGDITSFDYNTLADAVLHLMFTGRRGGEALWRAANRNLSEAIEQATSLAPVRLLDVRREFPVAWSRLTTDEANEAGLFLLELDLRREHYPFWATNLLSPDEPVPAVSLFADTKLSSLRLTDTPTGTGAFDELTAVADLGNLLFATMSTVGRPGPIGTFRLYLDANDIDDLWLAVQWAGEAQA